MKDSHKDTKDTKVTPIYAKLDIIKPWRSDEEGRVQRMLELDPVPIYERILDRLNPFDRNNASFGVEHIHPEQIPGICTCGCGQELPKGRRKWVDYSGHSEFWYDIRSIIAGYLNPTIWYVRNIFGDKCAICGENYGDDLDHITPVKHGGGACWLNNYQLLCNDCHKIKTKRDFKWGEFAEPKPIKDKVDINQLNCFSDR